MKRSSVVITLVIVGGTALLLSTCHSCSSTSFPLSFLGFNRPAPQPVIIPPYAPGFGPGTLVDRSHLWQPPGVLWPTTPSFYRGGLSFVPYASAPIWIDPSRRETARSSGTGVHPGYWGRWGGSSGSGSSSSSGKSSSSSSSGVSRGGFGGSGHAAGGGGSS
jgi:hypothetical protein